MANILNCRVIFLQIKQKQKSFEAEALNFRVLIDCSYQENLKKLKEAISLIVYKRNSYVIDKIVSLRKIFSQNLFILSWFLLLFLLLFLLIVYISLAFHLEVFQSELFRIYRINMWKFGISMVNVKQWFENQ